MQDISYFGGILVVVAVALLVAVLSNRVSEHVQVPAPAIFVAGAATVAAAVPQIQAPSHQAVERLVSVALVIILFDGGMHIGRTRLRRALRPVVVTGTVGTVLTVAATAVAVHLVFGIEWYIAVLVATAVAPTDPAVVFSVLGKREVAEPAGTILEGESGANDPVGIALMTSLITAGGLSLHAFAQVGVQFVIQMGVGFIVGLVGGQLLLLTMRRVALPSEGLYAIRTLATALLIYGAAAVAHGSGFLAVFVAGVMVGDANAPYKREIERFHGALASLAEIVAFVILGLTVDLSMLATRDVLIPGLVIGAALVILRPLVVGICLAGSGLRRNEKAFVLFAGLKGAVPILLGSLLLQSHIPDAHRYYGIVVLVVAFSVLVQGTLTPTVAAWLRVPMRTVEQEPWALGVRLRNEPQGVHRITVASDSLAAGGRLDELPLDGAWVSFAVRQGSLIPVSGDTQLLPDDELLVLAQPELREQLLDTFSRPASPA